VSGRPRRARPEDAPAIAALVNRAYEKYVARIGQEPYPITVDYADAIARHDVWVTEDGGEIVAAHVLIAEPDGLLIDNVAVDPAHQGKGLGRQLLRFAENEARREGYTALRLYTNERMTEKHHALRSIRLRRNRTRNTARP
jgi:GNAT superfamily N-acetyltransferase